MLRNDIDSWGAPAKLFHWVMALLIFAQIALGLFAVSWHVSPTKLNLFVWHKSIGMLILTLLALRLLWRLIDGTPAKQPMPRWMAAAAKLVQFALYALLIAVPATAVLGTWLEGIPVTLPGFDIAPQIAKAHGLGQLIMEIHTTLGNAILWVAGVHAAAALFHHFYLRDEVFQSMAPGA